MIKITDAPCQNAIKSLTKAKDVKKIAKVNCLENFTMFYAETAMDYIIEALDIDSVEGANYFNELCDSCKLQSHSVSWSRYVPMHPYRSSILQQICGIVYEKLRK